MNDISELSRQRIANNDILKILDSKRIEDVEIMNLKDRPLINQYWNIESQQRIHNVVNMLKDKNIVFEKGEDRNGSGEKGIQLVWDNTLVRGLDYYCHTTFEFVECRERKEKQQQEEEKHTRESNDSDETTTLKTSTSSSSELLLGTQQGTVLAGGRYDELYSLLSDSKYNISAIGWAMGVDRIQLMLEGIEKEENEKMTEEKKTIRWPKEKNKICILPIAEKDWNGVDHLELITSTAVQIGIDLRHLNTKGEGAIGEEEDDDETVAHRVIVSNNKMDRMKKQIKFSNRENAICSILVGGDELIERGCVSVRDMNARTQKEVKVEDVAEYVQHYF